MRSSPSWTNASIADTPPGVILDPQALDRRVERRYATPARELTSVVERFWALAWDLDSAVTVPSALVPAFSVNLTWETGPGRSRVDNRSMSTGGEGLPLGADAGGQAVVTGVPSGRFEVEVRGAGSVVGVKFEPGAFTGCTGAPADSLTDRTVPAGDILPPAVVAAFTEAATATDPDQPARLAIALEPLLAGVDGHWELARRAVAVATEPDILTVEQLAERMHVGVRSLQRLLRHYIGLPPKKVISRRRIQDAVAALDRDADEPPAGLAVRLGFTDQPHFTREFSAVVGMPPSRYAATVRRSASQAVPYQRAMSGESGQRA